MSEAGEAADPDRKVRTHVEVIAAAGGAAALARVLDLPANRIYAWKRGGRIPEKSWPGLARQGPATVEDLSWASALGKPDGRGRRPEVVASLPERPADWLLAPSPGPTLRLRPPDERRSRRHEAARRRLTVFCKLIDVPGVGRVKPARPRPTAA